MKKIFSLLVLAISVLFLASCSNKNNLDGKYYNIYNGTRVVK